MRRFIFILITLLTGLAFLLSTGCKKEHWRDEPEEDEPGPGPRPPPVPGVR
ncbi:MAG: hypothetical protein JRJ87_26455 [Deltaproteobacteria bacterium]|nr:hypothetical protein [Deltaproteobacteria bacterium]